MTNYTVTALGVQGTSQAEVGLGLTSSPANASLAVYQGCFLVGKNGAQVSCSIPAPVAVPAGEFMINAIFGLTNPPDFTNAILYYSFTCDPPASSAAATTLLGEVPRAARSFELPSAPIVLPFQHHVK